MSDFDKVGRDFIAYYDTVRGYVRENLVRQNLISYLSKPTTAIDVGGGDGRDAVWLVKLGYEVDFTDPSSQMTKKAQQTFNKAGINVTIHQKAQIKKKFKLVLSHGVLMYTNKPEQHLGELSRLCQRGAIVSLLTKGFDGSLVRAIQEHKLTAVNHLITTGKSVNNLGLLVWAFKPDEVIQMCRRQGLLLVDWQGIRIATDQDRRPLISVGAAERQRILEIEAQLGRQSTTKGLGQMIHYVLRKL